MEALRIKSFRTDFKTVAIRLLALNGFSVENSYNPHNIKAYVLAHEHGVFCVAIGSNLQEALDNAVDNNCMDHMRINEPDSADYEHHCALGNAGELFDIDYLTVHSEVRFND